MTTFTATITNTSTFGDVPRTKDKTSLSAGFGVKPKLTLARGVRVTVGLGMHLAQTLKLVRGIALTDGVTFKSPTSGLRKLKVTLSQAVKIHPRLSRALPVKLSIGLGFHNVLKVVRAVTVLQKLSFGTSQTSAGRYRRALLQAFRLSAKDALFLGGHLSVGLGLHDAPTRQFRTPAGLTQSLGLHPVLTQALLFRLDVGDHVDIHPARLVRMLYEGDPLLDTIQMFAAYVDPGGGLTTWAVNTRTSAVTEYRNYYFNSIAKLGHKFLGADATGLWELDGELDGTEAISTRIKNGLMQLSGSHFTSFKAAYLGLRIRDDATDFILKLHAGDGREYVYAVKPNNMRTTRVNMGKGLRSRYFSFELVTAGADYDLDSVEFIPISSQRRV